MMDNDGQAERLLGLSEDPADEKRSGNAGNDVGLDYRRVSDVADLAGVRSVFVVVAEARGGDEED